MSELSNDFCLTTQRTLPRPNAFLSAYPITPAASNFVRQVRLSAADIIHGRDKRLLVIVGPCSIHEENSALEYADLLARVARDFADELFIVMRVYFEKPRTLLGWKGLINDPWLDESFDINYGLQLARKILLHLAGTGLPAATEFLDNIIPHYLSDLISWTAIGARTTQSPLHRELASGLAMPVGFKNSTDGNMQVAIDAVNAARHSQCFLSLSGSGETTIARTVGNANGHIVLRGSQVAANYTRDSVSQAENALAHAGLPGRLMIDCSHGNSTRDFTQQARVITAVAEQLQQHKSPILGVMLESNLVAGKQSVNANRPLVYGQSITDACISWEQTVPLLEQLARAVKMQNKIN
jgi:3-deoxy-7-phosphoheptulonate synthase